MTDPLTELRYLEADLMTQTSGIARQLAFSTSDIRDAAIDTPLPKIVSFPPLKFLDLECGGGTDRT